VRAKSISLLCAIPILAGLGAGAAAAERPRRKLIGTNRILAEDAAEWMTRRYCGSFRSGSFVSGDRFRTPLSGSVVFDRAGRGYVAAGSFIAVVPKDGPVEVLTGQPGFAGNTDGPPGRATFGSAVDIALAGEDTLYVVDASNFTLRRIRRKAGVWHTETVAGVPGVRGRRDGRGRQALFEPTFDSVTVDGKGAVYVFSGEFIRKFEDGVVTTLNDRGGRGYVNGPLRSARFFHSQGSFHGLTCDGKGNLYVADKANIAIRKIDLRKGVISTFAGRGPKDKRDRPRDGAALEARFHPGGGPNTIYYDRVHDRFLVRSDDERAARVICRRGGEWVVRTLAARRETGDGKFELRPLGGRPCGVDNFGRAYLLARGGILVVESFRKVKSFRRAAGEGVTTSPGRPPRRLTIGGEAKVPSPSSLGQRHPAVAYGKGVYLLVWREGFSGAGGESDILAMRVDPSGKALDEKPLAVCTDAGIQDLPTVAFWRGAFLVAWVPRGKSADGARALQMRSVTPEGRLGAKTRSLPGAGLVTHPTLCSDGKDRVLLAWQEHNGEYFEVRGTRLDASGAPLDKPHIKIMSGSKPLGLGWARGGPLGLAWTGSGYVVCQSVYATYLNPQGQTALGLTRTWSAWSAGGFTAAAAWGKGFLFQCARPAPDPWGWGGNAAIVGMTVTPQGARYERDALMAMYPKTDKNLQFALLADGCAPNALDVSRWFNHPGWPMGMPGGLKHTRGDAWPSGAPAAAHNGESLVVVWPRGHLADNRRVRNRDLYLTRVLPDWGLVDRPPVAVSCAPTEETSPVMCAGPRGRVLLAYEKLTADGVAVRYRTIREETDRRPPAVVYVSPKSRTEMVVAFDEPVAEKGVEAKAFRIDGLTVKSAKLVPGGRAMRRMVLLETTPPQVGKEYTLVTSGVRDRSPAGNTAKDAAFKFLAKPGLMQRRDQVTRWATDGPPTEFYRSRCPVGHRDYIARWNVLAVLPREATKHPFDPAKAWPSPGEEVKFGAVTAKWREIKGEAVDLGGWFGRKAESMVYAATYLFSDRAREAVLRLDTNDHNRAWLNGKLVNDGITAATSGRGSHSYSDEVPVKLRRGWNRLLVQVENRAGYWFLCGQITDRYGQPIHELTWQLEKPAEQPAAKPE
jgi:hypothetical protein